MKPLPFRPGDEVVYQIFPDRFRDGDPSNNPRRGAWRWRGLPVRTSKDPRLLTTFPSGHRTFFGGDLAGVREAIPHILSVGATAVYLTPIFRAPSTHRYDTIDYHAIDPALGGRPAFDALVRALRAAGIRLVLDGVFNHTSADHPWHRDPATRRRFYCLRRDGARPDAQGWMMGRSLMKLDPENPEVARRLLEVIDAWPEADAWRLDAAHLLPRAFLRMIRERAAPRPTIVEDWTHAAHYFRAEGGGPLADGVTNFLFRDALERFLVEDCSPETFLERLRVWIDGYPWRNVLSSWNFLDNHDTDRLASKVTPARLRLAFVLLFTLPGTPLLYQGDEVGGTMTTAHARAPMEWDPRRWDRRLLVHVRRLAALRRATPALRQGRWRPLYAENRHRTFAYERYLGRTRVVVAANDGYRPARFEAGGHRFDLPAGGWAIRA